MPSVWTSHCDSALYLIQLHSRGTLNYSWQVNDLKNAAFFFLLANPISFLCCSFLHTAASLQQFVQPTHNTGLLLAVSTCACAGGGRRRVTASASCWWGNGKKRCWTCSSSVHTQNTHVGIPSLVHTGDQSVWCCVEPGAGLILMSPFRLRTLYDSVISHVLQVRPTVSLQRRDADGTPLGWFWCEVPCCLPNTYHVTHPICIWTNINLSYTASAHRRLLKGRKEGGRAGAISSPKSAG